MNAAQYLRALRERCGWDDYVRVLESPLTNSLRDQRYALLGIDPAHIPQNVSAETMHSQFTGVFREGLVAAFDRISNTLKQVPEVEILPLGDFNALATSAPNGDPIVILDSSLMSALATFADSLAELTIQDVSSGHTTDPTLPFQVLFDAMLHSIGMAAPGSVEYLATTRVCTHCSSAQAATSLAEAFAASILAHEYAHHALGHLQQTTSFMLTGPAGTVEVNALVRSRTQELQADALGHRAFREYCALPLEDGTRTLEEECECAALLLADILVLLERLKYDGRMPDAATRTHPTAEVRREQIAAYWLPVAPTRALDWYSHLGRRVAFMNEVVDDVLRRRTDGPRPMGPDA